MQEKIVEIIVYIIKEMRDNKDLGDINLNELTDYGYTETEISTALSWVIDKISLGESVFLAEGKEAQNSHRIFHEAEKSVITKEAQGYIILLSELGVIGGLDIELIVERVMLSGFHKADLTNIKSVIAGVLFDRGEVNAPGSRFMLTSHDTIH